MFLFRRHDEVTHRAWFFRSFPKSLRNCSDFLLLIIATDNACFLMRGHVHRRSILRALTAA